MPSSARHQWHHPTIPPTPTAASAVNSPGASPPHTARSFASTTAAASAVSSPRGHDQTADTPSALASAAASPSQGFFTLQHVVTPRRATAADLAAAAAAAAALELEQQERTAVARRDNLFVASRQRWTEKWDQLQAKRQWTDEHPYDMYDEVKADLAKVAHRDLQVFHQRRAAHADLRRRQQAAWDIELAHRAREVRALEREASVRGDFQQFNADKLLAHYSGLTERLLDAEVAKAETMELELRDSLRRTQARMKGEEQQAIFVDSQRAQRELEHYAAVEAIKRAEAATRAKQANQARLLQMRTGGRARLHG